MNFSLFLINNGFMLFGKFKIYYYAICIVLGFLLAAISIIPIFKRHGFEPDLIVDLLIGVIPLAIIFARLWFSILNFKRVFMTGYGFWGLFKIRDGGLAIQGGIVGGLLGLIIVCKIKHIDWKKVTDCVAVGLPLGQAIGRWGNFFNQEVYGKPTSITWMPYAVYIEDIGEYRQALCFYEMFANLILFAILYFFMFHYKGKRSLYSTGLYLLCYGIIRSILEPMRDEIFQMGNAKFLPASVWASIVFIVVGVGLITFVLIKDVIDKNYWWKDFFKKEKSVPKMEDNDA